MGIDSKKKKKKVLRAWKEMYFKIYESGSFKNEGPGQVWASCGTSGHALVWASLGASGPQTFCLEREIQLAEIIERTSEQCPTLRDWYSEKPTADWQCQPGKVSWAGFITLPSL